MTAEKNQVSRTGGAFFSIGLKLAGTTVAVVAVLAACVYLALTRYERRSMMASKEAAASMVTRLYIASAVAPLTFGDAKGVQDAVAQLSADDDIVYAAAWSAPDKGTALDDPLAELRRGETVSAPTTIPTAMQIRRTDTVLVTDAPVQDPSGKTVGVVEAAFSLAHEQQALAAIERRILDTSIAASVVLTVALLFLARRVIVLPLARLARAAQALERGDRAPVEWTANDEIGKLSAAFVSMSGAIAERERRIAERNRDMRRVLDNVEDGFIAVDAAGGMSEEHSSIVEQWFGPPEAGGTLFDYFRKFGGDRLADWLRLNWESLADGFLPLAVVIDQLPSRFERGGRFYAVSYRPILDGDVLQDMLVVIRDVTEKVELERAELMQREMMVIFKHVLADRVGFDEFFKEAASLVQSIEHPDDLDDVTLRRQIHTLKGNAAMLGLDSVSRYCHELESTMVEDIARPSPARVTGLRTVWDGVASTYDKFSGGRVAQIVIDEDEQRELLRVIRSGAGAREIAAIVTSWRYDRADARMTSLAEMIRHVARRLGKGEVDVEIAPTKLRLPPQRWAPFWQVCSHVVRNAVDHGLEAPDARTQLGKPANGVIRMSFEEREGQVVFRFGDDGAGIDWERLAAKAAKRGLPVATRKDLEKALFIDSVTTRDEVTLMSGRGVGLGAVLQCVSANGGTVEVESARGVGTTWAFRFPSSMLVG
jgi:two-component system chemotaxis sensor kinase CheA